MFAKNSRYRRMPETFTFDTKGRWTQSVESRLSRPTDGALAHTLAEGERLDGLAQQYYEEPRLWWRICDANPDFLSPLALLGAEPIVTVNFPVTPKDEREPCWSLLIMALSAMVGVESVTITETPKVTGIDQKEQENVNNLTCDAETFKSTVTVTYNRLTKPSSDVKSMDEAVIQEINNAGFIAEEPEFLERIGQSIAIPQYFQD